MNFRIYGPFEVRRNYGLISRSQDDLWEEAEQHQEGLSEACGCYIFSIRAARGELPWYVGSATRRDFASECFSYRNQALYNEACGSRQGTPRLYVVAKFTPNWRFSKPGRGHNDIRFLEKMLIGLSLRRNRGLLNMRDTALLRRMSVPGLVNAKPGQPSTAVSALKGVLGI